MVVHICPYIYIYIYVCYGRAASPLSQNILLVAKGEGQEEQPEAPGGQDQGAGRGQDGPVAAGKQQMLLQGRDREQDKGFCGWLGTKQGSVGGCHILLCC